MVRRFRGAAGFAMGLKYTSFICPVTLIALIAWDTVRQRGLFKQTSGQVMLFSVVALVVASPWYLRNLAFTGNPVYPFATVSGMDGGGVSGVRTGMPRPGQDWAATWERCWHCR